MNKTITIKQLREAVLKAPREIEMEGKIFLQRGLSEYKRIAVQSPPWKVGQRGGGIPIKKGNLKEKHRTEIRGLEGRFGVDPSKVKYAGYVHGGTYKMKARPWLEYARVKGDNAVRKHYKVLMDKILQVIAT